MSDNEAAQVKKTDWTSIDTKLKHDGREIVLPASPSNMPIDDAIATLHRIKKDEETEYSISEVVEGAPWDAMVCVYRAMQAIYGVVTVSGIPTFFGTMRPEMLTVRVGPGATDIIQVPNGKMTLPNVAKPIMVSLDLRGVVINGVAKKHERAVLIELANKAREIMRAASIYRGKSIRLAVDDDGDLILQEQPRFLDLASVREDDMIHTDETGSMIRTNIFSPLRNTDACRRHGIPLKRGILLEGPYGTGKSLTARVTAKVANENGWTFIMLDRVQGLKTAIEFGRRYQPCVIFAEDIDRSADRNDEDVNDLVNLMDGVATKDSEVMVVLTTNFADKIDKALLRPGRFDAVISIQPPDAKTVERLIRAYARDLLASTADLAGVGAALTGNIPATIREVVERAKLSMLMEERDRLETDDLLTSALGMKRHLALLAPKVEEKSPKKVLFDALIGVVQAAGNVDASGELISDEQIDRIENLAEGARDAARSAVSLAREGVGIAVDVSQKVDVIDKKLVA